MGYPIGVAVVRGSGVVHFSSGTTTSTSYTDCGIIATQSQAYDGYSYRVRVIGSDDVASAYTNRAFVWVSRRERNQSAMTPSTRPAAV